MDDNAFYQFFQSPQQVYHRRYEAMRAVFVDQRCQKEVADQFGYQYSTMRQMVYEFRQALRQDQEPPFFES